MRRSMLAGFLTLATAFAVLLFGSLSHGYAQIAGPVGDEFNNTSFAAPFHAVCGANAFPTSCPDAAGTGVWSLNQERPGFLRIYTLPGTEEGASNNARNMILQPISQYADWTITTSMQFPGPTSTTNQVTALGQTAGLLVYGDDNNFIYVGRVYPQSASSNLEFVQENNGTDTVATVPEPNVSAINNLIYLRLTKVGNTYQGFYSTDNVNFTSFTTTNLPATATPTATATATGTLTPTATATATATATVTPIPLIYSASYTSPQVGLFAWGGTSPSVPSNALPADFDWFRVGNSQTPAPTPVATNTPTLTASPVTATPTATATFVVVTATPTATSSVPTSTSVPATATATATALPTATATNTPIPTTAPIPTPTPRPPKPKAKPALFRYVSVWYHTVRQGTFDHVDVQTQARVRHGIWVHVYFPNGLHYNYYENTDPSGHWVKEFSIPKHVTTRYSNLAIITIQLWRGKSTAKSFDVITLV